MNPRLDEVSVAVRKTFRLISGAARWDLTLQMVGGSVAVTLDNEKGAEHLTFAVGPDEDPREAVARAAARREAVAA